MSSFLDLANAARLGCLILKSWTNDNHVPAHRSIRGCCGCWGASSTVVYHQGSYRVSLPQNSVGNWPSAAASARVSSRSLHLDALEILYMDMMTSRLLGEDFRFRSCPSVFCGSRLRVECSIMHLPSPSLLGRRILRKIVEYTRC